MSAAALIVLFAGCARDEDSPSPAISDKTASSSSTAQPAGPRVVSNDGTYLVTYESRPAVIPLNEPFDLTVWVQSADGNPLPAPIDLVVDGRMPQHRHGMNRVPTVEQTEDGRFLIEGMLFHMPGLWELHLDVGQGGVTERAQFAIDLE